MLRFCNQLRVRVYVANMLPWYDRLSCYSQCEVHRHGLEDSGLLPLVLNRGFGTVYCPAATSTTADAARTRPLQLLGSCAEVALGQLQPCYGPACVSALGSRRHTPGAPSISIEPSAISARRRQSNGLVKSSAQPARHGRGPSCLHTAHHPHRAAARPERDRDCRRCFAAAGL